MRFSSFLVPLCVTVIAADKLAPTTETNTGAGTKADSQTDSSSFALIPASPIALLNASAICQSPEVETIGIYFRAMPSTGSSEAENAMGAANFRGKQLISDSLLSLLCHQCGPDSHLIPSSQCCSGEEYMCMARGATSVKRAHMQFGEPVDAMDHHERFDISLVRWAKRHTRLVEITYLRDPGSWVRSVWRRHWSNVNMARNTEGADEANAIRDALSRGELDPHDDAAAPAFTEFIERSPWLWNAFTRMLASNYTEGTFYVHIAGLPRRRVDRETGIPDLAQSAETITAWTELDEEDENASGTQMLKAARTQLAALPFFGLYDRLAESIELQAHTFCYGELESTLESVRERSGTLASGSDAPVRGASPLPASAQAAIERRFALDLRLYEKAALEFDTRMDDMRNMQAKTEPGRSSCRLMRTACVIDAETPPVEDHAKMSKEAKQRREEAGEEEHVPSEFQDQDARDRLMKAAQQMKGMGVGAQGRMGADWGQGGLPGGGLPPGFPGTRGEL